MRYNNLSHPGKVGSKKVKNRVDLRKTREKSLAEKRTALGPDLPALFSNHDGWADALLAQARGQADPLWRLPLWAPYRRMLRSDQADLLNAASAPLGGAITAALFLEGFVSPQVPWLHLDLFAWNLEERPGRPKGGEAQGLRALFALLAQRFPTR